MIGAVQGASWGAQDTMGYAAMGYAAMRNRQQAAQPQEGLLSAAADAARQSGKSGNTGDLSEKYRCTSCEERTYVDGSNDPGVSMKTPTKVDAQSAASAVMSHEREHVTRNAFKAQAEGREVLSSTITMHISTCGECGKPYVSGGTTRTVTADKQQNKQQEPGRLLDIRA